MVALVAGTRDIIEEVELGRTLLLQGHLDTAQKVLVKLCQEQPECSEAFRVLAMVLFKRGDDRRGQPLLEYADELDVQQIFEPTSPGEDVFSDAKTMQTRRRSSSELRRPDSLKSAASPPPPAAPHPFPQPVFPPSGPPVPLHLQPRRRRGAVRFFLLLLGAGAAAMAAYHLRDRIRPLGSTTRADLDRALASGSLELLMRAREGARIDLSVAAPDPDSLVRLALVDALLAGDYAIGATQDAEAALRRAAAAPSPNHDRGSLAESARALLFLAVGNRAAARQHADAAMATADVPVWALLASARARSISGDAAGAQRDLDRAIGMGPEIAPVVVDWALARFDGGDPVAARRVLATLLSQAQGNSRARLALAKAERALGEPDWVKHLNLACGGDTKISRLIRSECELEGAVRSRLEGDRAGALRKAREVAQTAEEPQTIADAALLMASLGDIDAGDEFLARARKLADPAMVSLLWADFAIRLGRGEVVRPSGALEHPAGPERDLVALRAAYAQGGAAALALVLKTLPPGIRDIDGDVRAFAALARPGGPSKPELASLEKRGDKGNSLASYVLGLVAMGAKDHKLAWRRLEKALALHGDACRAAQLYVDAVKHIKRGAAVSRTGLRAIHARNAKCPLPDM